MQSQSQRSNDWPCFDRSSELVYLCFMRTIYLLPTVARKCSILMYADDTVLFYSVTVAATVEKSVNEDLDLMDGGSIITAFS